MPRTIHHRGRLLLCAWLTCAAAGCAPAEPSAEQAARSTDRFVPSPAEAETALRAVFEAWRRGEPPGLVPNTSPAVHITDTFRKPGETLVDYHILGEVPSERPRCFAVDLRFDPERIERARFNVVGIDPLWVFRLEDVELLAHWEHKMESAEPGDEPIKGAETGAGREAAETSSSTVEPAAVPPSGTEP